MPKKPDIHRLLDFQELLLQFQAIHRVTHIPKTFEQENDTEHSYNLAMSAWFLCEYFPHLNRDKIIRFALVHDMVEVHAGDTYIYGDQASIDSKVEREHAALERLKTDWQDFPELGNTIEEYETHASEEAKFVYALDKIMPIMVIMLSGGFTWKQEGISHIRLDEVKRHKVAVSKDIEPYYHELYQLLVDNQHLFNPKEKPRPHKR